MIASIWLQKYAWIQCTLWISGGYPGGEGVLGYVLGGYVPPRSPNLGPLLERICIQNNYYTPHTRLGILGEYQPPSPPPPMDIKWSNYVQYIYMIYILDSVILFICA